MQSVVEFLKRHTDAAWAIALAGALLSLLYPVVEAYYVWIGGDNILVDHPDLSFWVLGNYFFEPFVAAILLGALIRKWSVLYIGLIGLVAQLVLVTGTIFTNDTPAGSLTGTGTGGAAGISKAEAYAQAYLTSALHWIWLGFLIALGVFIGRRLGDMFGELQSEG